MLANNNKGEERKKMYYIIISEDRNFFCGFDKRIDSVPICSQILFVTKEIEGGSAKLKVYI